MKLTMKLGFVVLSSILIYLEFVNGEKEIFKPETVGNICETPYIVSIHILKKEFLCAGVILESRWIVTAADCVRDIDTNLLTIKAGSNVIGDIYGQWVIGEEVIVGDTSINDHDYGQIALIKLKVPLTFDEKTDKIAVISEEELVEEVPYKHSAFSAGWRDPVALNQYLERVKLKLLFEDVCNKTVMAPSDYYYFNESLHVCFNSMKDKVVSKYNGAPIIINAKLLAVKSFNARNFDDNSLFTNLIYFKNFIDQYINNEEESPDDVNPEDALQTLIKKIQDAYEQFIDSCKHYVYTGFSKSENSLQRKSRSSITPIFQLEVFIQCIKDETSIFPICNEIWTLNHHGETILLINTFAQCVITEDESQELWRQDIHINFTLSFLGETSEGSFKIPLESIFEVLQSEEDTYVHKVNPKLNVLNKYLDLSRSEEIATEKSVRDENYIDDFLQNPNSDLITKFISNKKDFFPIFRSESNYLDYVLKALEDDINLNFILNMYVEHIPDDVDYVLFKNTPFSVGFIVDESSA